MRNLVRSSRLQPRMRTTALAIVRNCPSKAWVSEIRAVFNWVRSNISYRLDTYDTEVIAAPERTIELGAGDCASFCILIIALLQQLGHPCWFLALSFTPEVAFSHVIVQTRGAGETGVISLDATEPYAMGWFPPGVTHTMRCDV